MSRKNERRNQIAMKFALVTALVNLAAAVVGLLNKIIDWLAR